MRERRGVDDLRLLCSGPGKVGEAQANTRALNGARLDHAPFQVFAPERRTRVVTGPRIGISKAMEVHWRFGLEGSPFLSRRFA